MEAAAEDPAIADFLDAHSGAYGQFVPRPDDPANFDQQTSYVNAKDVVSFLLGGNASGKTSASAARCARFVLHTKPPRRNTPFWVIAKNYEQVCSVCWSEKLWGQHFIPPCEVQWNNISWIDTKRGWPSVVPLRPWPNGNSWCLHFKSYEQGREAMQAASIGGFWFSEQFPSDLFLEVFRGCREYMFPGGQFCEFTPIDPDMCLWVERMIDAAPKGWGFYRCNTESNRGNLASDWYENFVAACPDEMLDTRIRGALASFEGVIFQSFSPAVHVVEINDFPENVEHYRGIDWGASEEHPFTCTWGYRDGTGDWYVYDEYWNNSQSAITSDHFDEILERSAGWGWHPAGRMDQWHRETFGDPSRPGEINLFASKGIAVTMARNDIYQGIDCIRSLLKVNPFTHRPKLLIHPRCKHLIEELRKYRWKKGRKPGEGNVRNPAVAKPIPLPRDNDQVDSCRYMIFSAEKSRGAAPGSTDYREYQAKRHSVLVDPNTLRAGRRFGR